MVYINGTGAITPQKTVSEDFPFEAQSSAGSWLQCIEPDYKHYLDSRSSRRLSRIIKMGITAAVMALQDADLELPDGIIAGSGLGCMIDTEKFLTSIIETEERFLNPASFIYSTHNSISSQVAMQLNCAGYNQTYVQGAISFESALLDGTLLLLESGFQTLLVGGIDEMTANLFDITRRLGLWKRKPIDSLDLYATHSKGSLAGEGATFFVLSSEKSHHTYANLLETTTLHHSDTDSAIENRIRQLLSENQLGLNDLDLCILGRNGDNRFDGVYDRLETGLLKSIPCVNYKHLCGEYPTASSFACWLAANILKHQVIPETMMSGNNRSTAVKNILIYNQDPDSNHGLILLQAC